MNVLLINPTRTGSDSYITPPLHLVYIAQSIIEAGHKAKIVDLHYKWAKATGMFESKSNFENKMIEEILKQEFDLLGIGSIVSSYDFTKRLVSAVKQANQDLPIIIGGGMSMAVKDLWLEKTKVDFLVESDGEKVIQRFMEAYPNMEELKKIPGLHVRQNGRFVSTPTELPKNLDYINFPKWELLENLSDYMDIQKSWVNLTMPVNFHLGDEEKVLPIVFTRGCPYKCTFCYHVNNLHRKHSIEYVINYINHLKKKYQVSFLQTWDELIVANPKWLADLCDEIVAQNIDIQIFTSGGKPNLIDRNLLKKMKKAGFMRISYGIESGSQKMLDIMKKKTTVSQNFNAVKLSVEEGLFVHLNMIAGMPGEDISTVKETIQFLVSLGKKGIISSKNISYSFATGYPGTELYQYMLEHGIVTNTEKYLIDQVGVKGYKYNICGMNVTLMRYLIHIAKIKIDFYYYLQSKQYYKAFSSSSTMILRVPTVVLLPLIPKKIRLFFHRILHRLLPTLFK